MNQQQYLSVQNKLYNKQILTGQDEQAIVRECETLFDCIQWIRQNILIKEYNNSLLQYLELIISNLSIYYNFTYPLKDLEIIALWICVEKGIYFPLNLYHLECYTNDLVFFAAMTLNIKMLSRLDPKAEAKKILDISRYMSPYLDKYYRIQEQLNK